MSLAEAVLRIPDSDTIDELIYEKICHTDWSPHIGTSKPFVINASAQSLMTAARLLEMKSPLSLLHSTFQPFADAPIRYAVRQSVFQGLLAMARAFVLGSTIERALDRTATQQERIYRFSFDMLGEAARTDADSDRYFQAYEHAARVTGRASNGRGVVAGPALSVKLSALYPRYEMAQRTAALPILTDRVLQLARIARQYDIGLCIDAEESDRLELSLEIIENVCRDPSLQGWNGFGLAVQAYQKRALATIRILSEIAQQTHRVLNIRLVKGAYWDTEIKRCQENGLVDYPVYTRKINTDASYLACAQQLFEHSSCLFPQFATHNAQTIAAILAMADGRPFEFQRLHGMGRELYNTLLSSHTYPGVACRVYAPVGSYPDLLSYLVRRLLENGANTSFVHQLAQTDTASLSRIIVDPAQAARDAHPKQHPQIPLPCHLYGLSRVNSMGIDLSDGATLLSLASDLQTHATTCFQAHPLVGGHPSKHPCHSIYAPAHRDHIVGSVCHATHDDVEEALSRGHAIAPTWSATPVHERAAILKKAADQMEKQITLFMALCIREAGKTAPDSVAEIREAIDFLRFYADEALRLRPTHSVSGQGIFVCISPWNFPLAIFIGQVSAALVTGNVVMAKPAGQTPLIAYEAVRLLHKAGIPPDALAFLPGSGQAVGARLISDLRIVGVAFTGSVESARAICQNLARQGRGPIPFIAETGGMNAMIVDSSALPEQAVRDILISAFGSAGQRCSALRVLYVQHDHAENVLTMLRGALQTLRVGSPENLHTDIGPVIDESARDGLMRHIHDMTAKGYAPLSGPTSSEAEDGFFLAPHLVEISSLHELEHEVFGPVLHIIRFHKNQIDRILSDIRETGYGLTMGIQSRLESRSQTIFSNSAVGNTYVNRSMTGAVVGVHPFGGEGLSGTGPKAGGPHYLLRFIMQETTPSTVTDHPQLPSLQAGSLPESVAQDTVSPFEKFLKQTSYQEDNFTLNASLSHRTTCLKKLSSRLQNTDLSRQGTKGTPDAVKNNLAHSLPQQLDALTDYIFSQMSAPVSLPGPTGEKNELHLFGRGFTLALLDHTGSVNAMTLAVTSAYGVGNRVLAIAHPAHKDILAPLISGLDHVEWLFISPERAISFIAASPLLKVIFVTGSPDLLDRVTRAAADRHGPLLSIVTGPITVETLFLFCVERTLTIDTTAACGNATLLNLHTDETA